MLTVPSEFCRNRAEEAKAAVEGAVWLIEHVCTKVGLQDLSDTRVLDVGCGVRFAQAFINHRIPVKQYVGIDVYKEMIDFLQSHVTDPRLAFRHIDVHNARYNPDGEPLTETTALGVEEQSFDLIWLFSVFTHLAPHDYVAMLKLLRRYVAPDGRLFFTLFIDELTTTGYGYSDRMARVLAQSGHEVATHDASPPADPSPFRDVDPSRPLMFALYSREHALELISGTGWRAIEVALPNQHAQHQIVCVPE